MITTVQLPQYIFGKQDGPFTLMPHRPRAVSGFRPSTPKFGPSRESVWTFTLNSGPLIREEAIEMEAFFAQIGHGDWCFTAYDTLRVLPLGRGNGFAAANAEVLFTDAGGAPHSFASNLRLISGGTTVLVKTAAPRKATSLLVKGIDPALSGQKVLKRGDHFSLGLPGEMNLHMATADVVCDAGGDARIEFLAPLWKRALANDLVEFFKPSARFGLYSESGGTVELVRSAGQLARGTLRASEVPFQEPQE